MAHAKCVDCGNFYSHKRRELGYKTCLECGEANIKPVIDNMRKQCAPAYNKGAYQYITDMQMVKDLGR